MTDIIDFYLNTLCVKMLSSLDALHISAVLEDCVDQLEVLGHIMPSSLEGRPDATKVTLLLFKQYNKS